jgi:hypothetical protein
MALAWGGCRLPPLAGQVDSLAGAARRHYREAMTAYREGDYPRAREYMLQAATAWPTQPVYAYGAAALSARTADTAGAVRWLDLLADLGAWRDARRDPDFTALLGAPPLQGALARLERNRSPLTRSRVAFTIPQPDFFAESIDADSARGEWYVGSVRHGMVARVGTGGVIAELGPPAGARFGGVFAVRVDSERRRLWITTRIAPLFAGYRAGEPQTAGVAVYDLTTDRLVARLSLPDDGRPHTLGDLIVTAGGEVYLSDSESPVIYRGRLDAGGRLEVEPWLQSPLFRSLQGMALDDDARTLYVADYSHGILAVGLATRAVRHLPGPARASTLGIDGLVWWKASLIGIQNGITPPRVVALGLSGSRDRIERVEVLDRHLPLADEPTNATRRGDRLFYVANSHWPHYQDDGRLKPMARLAPTAILELPLPR